MAPKRLHSISKIVLIDDDLEVIKIVADSLNMLGYQSMTFQDPRQALEVIRKEKIDLVITDFQMSYMSGLEVIRAVKEQDNNIPVIVMTGNPDHEIETISLNGGAYSFFRKPLDFNRLVRLVTSTCNKYQAR